MVQSRQICFHRMGKKRMLFCLFILLCLFLNISISVAQPSLTVSKKAEGLGIVWGMSFLDQSTLIFTERSGRVGLLAVNSGKHVYIEGVPKVRAQGQGGLLDVAVAPNYASSGWVYFTYSKDQRGQGVTALARARLNQRKTRLIDWQDVLVTQSVSSSNVHYGSRIAFDAQGHVFFGVGDRGVRKNGQDLTNHAGTILRLNLDGSVPSDNPFVNKENILPEIWSYGHRNPQGLVFAADKQRLWEIEHGPRGGDEINLIQPGKNYGWPVVSHGKEYWGPFDVGEGKHKAGMEDPVKVYIPSIAPGSLLYYSGDAFPQWRGDLLAGSLKLRHLNHIQLDGVRAVEETRLLANLQQRIRALAQDPQGALYFSTDSGTIYQLQPNAIHRTD